MAGLKRRPGKIFFRSGLSDESDSSRESQQSNIESFLSSWIRGRRLSLYLPDDSYYRVVFEKDETGQRGSNLSCKVAVRIGSRTFVGASKRAKSLGAALERSLERVRVHCAEALRSASV